MILPWLFRLGALRFSSDAPDVPPPPPEKPIEVDKPRRKGRRSTIFARALTARPESPLGGEAATLGAPTPGGGLTGAARSGGALDRYMA